MWQKSIIYINIKYANIYCMNKPVNEASRTWNSLIKSEVLLLSKKGGEFFHHPLANRKQLGEHTSPLWQCCRKSIRNNTAQGHWLFSNWKHCAINPTFFEVVL